MSEDSRWQRDLIAALHLENLFESADLGFIDPERRKQLQPTQMESERAVENIRSWRAFLPEACVAKMINDGWQWST